MYPPSTVSNFARYAIALRHLQVRATRRSHPNNRAEGQLLANGLKLPRQGLEPLWLSSQSMKNCRSRTTKRGGEIESCVRHAHTTASVQASHRSSWSVATFT